MLPVLLTDECKPPISRLTGRVDESTNPGKEETPICIDQPKGNYSVMNYA